MAIEGGHGGDIVSTSATGRKMNKTPNIVTKPKATIDATIAVHLRRIIVSQGVTSSPTAVLSNGCRSPAQGETAYERNTICENAQTKQDAPALRRRAAAGSAARRHSL